MKNKFTIRLTILSLLLFVGNAFAADVLNYGDTNFPNYKRFSSITITNGAVITATNSVAKEAVQGVTTSAGAADAGKIGKLNGSGQYDSSFFGTPFTTSFTSTNMLFASGGQLIMSHALGGTPTLVQPRVICLSADLNYSANDEVIIPAYTGSDGRGIAVLVNSTNIVVRWGDAGSPLALGDKNSGAYTSATTAKWALIMKAWK